MRKGSVALGVPLVVILAAATARGPVVAQPDATGTVRVVVRYETPSGNEPLDGVEVWLGITGAPDRYGCTDEDGVVRFREVPAETDLYSATGPGTCENAGFRNPDTGKDMTGVSWGTTTASSRGTPSRSAAVTSWPSGTWRGRPMSKGSSARARGPRGSERPARTAPLGRPGTTSSSVAAAMT